jgi:hypothetical protein
MYFANREVPRPGQNQPLPGMAKTEKNKFYYYGVVETGW